MTNNEDYCYFNKRTNEILWTFGYNSEYSTFKDEDEYDDDIISMFDFFDKDDYNIMQDFIFTIEDEKKFKNLYKCSKGKGTFKRFRDEIDILDLTESWYEFRDNKYVEIAKEWCINNNIEIEVDC